MYLYCSPYGGFNDQLTLFDKAITYCTKYNRTLLLDTTKTCYQINWSDYFMFKDNQCPIICDINKIRELLHDKDKLSVYPSCIKVNLIDTITKNNEYSNLQLPIQDPKDDIVIHRAMGGGDGFPVFKLLVFNDNIKTHCNNKYSLIPNPYLGIQIRNTDHACDYVALYETNKELIHSYQTIYVATDCVEALQFFKTSCINSSVFNFTTFQVIGNLHTSNINSDTKIKDLMCDICMITMCDKLLTNSRGGFISLMKHCHKNDLVKRMFF